MIKKIIICSLILLLLTINIYSTEIEGREEDKIITNVFMFNSLAFILNMLTNYYGIIFLTCEYQVLCSDRLSISIIPTYAGSIALPFIATSLGLGLNMHLFNKGLSVAGQFFSKVFSVFLEKLLAGNYKFSYH